jgi:hypothetical protein
MDRRALAVAVAGLAPPDWDLADAPVKARAKPKAAPSPARAKKGPATSAKKPIASMSVADLQARLRAIPGELKALGEEVRSGEMAVTAAETFRRLLEGEAKALGAAVSAGGVATVEEVEQLRGILLDVTKGCDACRGRVTSALRELDR